MRRVNINLANATPGQLDGTASLVHGPGCVTWHSTYETTGSASASYQLFDGSTRNGPSLMYVTLLAAQSTRDSIVLHCLPFIDSLHYVLESGAVGGTIIAWVDHTCERELDLKHELLRAQLGIDFMSLTR